MADKTAIEWAEASWNPLVGCSVVSPGCTHCYAMREAGGRLANLPKYRGLTLGSNAGPVWTGEVRLWERALDQPLRWTKPRRIFVNSMSDLFHETVPSGWIKRILDVMRNAPQHVYQILTKRADRMKEFMAWWVVQHVEQPPSNWWLGVSVEDQPRAVERIPLLLETPAAVHWISAEPLLGPVDLWPGWLCYGYPKTPLDWVVAGGESGPRARAMHPDWARAMRDQCRATGVPFFFKQWGEWAPAPEEMNFAEGAALACRGNHEFEQWSSGHTMIRVGKKAAGRLLDGREWNEYPAPARRRAA